MREPVGEFAVVGQQYEAFGLGVELADGIDAAGRLGGSRSIARV